MKNKLHTTESRLSGPSLEAELMRAKTRRIPRAPLCKARALLFVALSCFLSTALPAQKSVSADASPASTPSAKAAQHSHLDRSGKSRKGKASYYGREFYKKEMADGTPMNPQSNAAASKTLPLGTKARVTNLKNGNSEVVEIRDRGPYVKGRIVDLSPKTADKLGLKKDGVAPVEVKPVEVPQADGSVKPGAGVQESERGRTSAELQDSHSLR
ncbi:septal ring lytic transglycosylase RlpA family protein [Paraburkholderia phytofirmans]|jgi:rare lipoprotein A|uniref:septal ring lytic transglycosylase RlpA family protein n=1 Tax=Paraburkholderia sp. BL9I2N2 TaxID=1938809 RepID=UPI0010DE8E35|nr:septal ring lytic transglycosylase RlpA family protein [Paraburkholderia sp. BL9I2N2]TCK95240.1 rare lipoprotein A [Paraburkholderia sp. BL9I2N2]